MGGDDRDKALYFGSWREIRSDLFLMDSRAPGCSPRLPPFGVRKIPYMGNTSEAASVGAVERHETGSAGCDTALVDLFLGE